MATITADEYREIVKAIINTATGGSANSSYPWNAINNGYYSAQDFYDLMQTRAVKNAGYDAVLNADGSVRTYTYINKNGKIADLGSYDDIVGAFNSNYQTGTASGGTVQFTQATDTAMTTATETAHSAVEAAGTMSKFTNGVKGAGNFVIGKVLPTVAAASTGIQLGKTIDSLLYNANPDFWNSHGMETLNPETWSTIASNDAGKTFLNVLFGIDENTGDTQMYMDENTLAYMTYYYKTLGALDPNTEYSKETVQDNITIPAGSSVISGVFNGEVYNKLSQGQQIGVSTLDNTPSYLYGTTGVSTKFSVYNQLGVVTTDEKNFRVNNFSYPKHYNGLGFNIYGDYTYNNKTVYYAAIPKDTVDWLKDGQVIYKGIIPNSDITGSDDWYTLLNNVAWYTQFGEKNIAGAVDGITDQTGAKIFDPSTVDDIASALQALKEQYPDLWNNRVENTVVQPDGTTKTYTYVPVPMPTGGTADQPTTEGAKQSNPEVDPSTATDTLLNTLVQILTQTKPAGMTDTPADPINPNPPDIGGGDTPVIVAPTGSANALYSIYNPSQSQLNSFGAWLWSSNFVDQILKLFNDPMQAIIGLHKVFASPSISGTGTIKVGYLDSGVSSNIVGNQYTMVDCGSVSLSEYFGNVFDYEPYTKVNLYLPFIGIVPLSVGEIMRSTIHVVYHVDVLTGACLAEVKITRDAAGGTLFQYSGNAAVQYPISSGSYMGIISGIMSIAGGVAGTIATGGAAMPVLLGAGASVGRMHTDISHSGNFSGNAGAMGIKTPYLIIDRPQTALAKNFPNYIGYPSNTTVKLSSCSGFTKVHEIHLENVPATNNELSDIEMKLKGGVII